MENNKLQFFMAMIPPTKTYQEHRLGVDKSGKPFVYPDAELKAVRNKLTAYLGKHVPVKPYSGAVRLTVRWCFPITGKHVVGEYKTSKPDTDNLQKLLKDCMTTVGYWKDDAQVASELTEKFYSDVPGIFVKVENVR